MNSRKSLLLGVGVLYAISLGGCGQGAEEAEARAVSDWRVEWEVQPGFEIDLDAEGFSLPTAIAFVPNPGPGPKDPLYFVTELRGAIKVVTNDRSVHTFADDFFRLTVEKEVPEGEGQGGLAGICLEPTNGYIFATFAYQDENKALRNDIIRFETRPSTFALEPVSQRTFTELFRAHPSGLSHQIGGCVIEDDLLYVSVGDGWRSDLAQDLGATNGKIIRMTLDGRPAEANPFYSESSPTGAGRYVWAYGLRNPFGLQMVDGRLFAAENGQNLDRFLEIREGTNYLWNGDDAAIAMNALFVMAPSLAPAQLEYYSGESGTFPDTYRESFFTALAASTSWRKTTVPGIMLLPYAPSEDRMRAVPSYFLRYRGSGDQMVTGVAFGPDGLYFVPVLPDGAGRSGIYKVRYSGASVSASGGAGIVAVDGRQLMTEKGCVSCHKIGSNGDYGGTAGPLLDPRTLVQQVQQRLGSQEYATALAELDGLTDEAYRASAAARQDVREAEGVEQVRVWLKHRIMNPRFDQMQSQMPDLGLTDAEAETIADYLIADGRGRDRMASARALLRRVAPASAGRKHLAFFGLSGFVLGGFLVGMLTLTVTGRGKFPRRLRRGTESPSDRVAERDRKKR